MAFLADLRGVAEVETLAAVADTAQFAGVKDGSSTAGDLLGNNYEPRGRLSASGTIAVVLSIVGNALRQSCFQLVHLSAVFSVVTLVRAVQETVERLRARRPSHTTPSTLATSASATAGSLRRWLRLGGFAKHVVN